MAQEKHYLDDFCRMIRERSSEHKRAINALHPIASTQMISILRQELDSMIRVIYLLAISDIEYREHLMRLTIDGEKWQHPNSRRQVTDRDMVALANSFQHWTEYVYRFGCAFIHLSEFHDYKTADPVAKLNTEDRNAIYNYMNQYHGMPSRDFSFQDLLMFLPMVFDKISSNLECYVKSLEEGKKIDLRE